MHSPLRRQLARQSSRSPTKTPRRLQQEPTRRETLEPRRLWPSQDRDIHLTPERAAPKPQRAWERKPRAGQKGKIVWKRPQHELPANQLRSKPSSSATGALADKTNTTPQKVTKKARLDAKGGIPVSRGEPFAKPLHWDRRSSGLIHKAPARQADTRWENDPQADQENAGITRTAPSKTDDSVFEVDDADVKIETSKAKQHLEESSSPQLQFTYGVPSSDDLSELLGNEEAVSGPKGQPTPQSRPILSPSASRTEEGPETPQLHANQVTPQSTPGIAPAIGRNVSVIEDTACHDDDLHDRETNVLEAAAAETGMTNSPVNGSTNAKDNEARSEEVVAAEDSVQIDNVTSGQSGSPAESQHSLSGEDPEDDGTPAMPVQEATDEAAAVDEPVSPIELSSLGPNDTNNTKDSVLGELPDQAVEAAQDEPTLVDSTRAEDFDIVPDLPNHFAESASFGLDQRPQQSPMRTDPTAAFGTPLASKTAPPTPGSTTVKIALNDDESILHDFISRTKASKAARIAKRSSDSHKRESEIIKKALASPGRVAEGTLEVDSPSDGKGRGSGLDSGMSENVATSPTLTLDPSASATSGGDHAQSTTRARRSKRKQANQVEKVADHDGEAQEDHSAPPPGPVTFSLRRRGEDGEKFALKKTEAQEWSMMTRSNTRRNKAGAVPVKAVLTRLRGGEITPEEAAAMYAGEGDIPDEQGKSTVRWNEQLVKFFEESMTSTKGLDEEVDVLSQLAGQSQPSADSGRPRAKRAKALGAMNGTPAKSKTGKIVLDDGGSEAPVQDETKAPATKSRNDRAKRSAPESQTQAEAGTDNAESNQRPSKQARRLPAPAMKAPTRGNAVDEPAAEEEEKKPVKKTAPRAAATQTRAAAQAEDGKQGKASGLRSGLPTRRGVRSRT